MISKILDKLFPSRIVEREKRQNRFQKAIDYLEEIRFQKFLEDKKMREDEKHPNSKMADGVTKCAVGRTWKRKDYKDLVSAIPRGSLEDYSKATGRSYTGCLNRLCMIGVVKRMTPTYNHVYTAIVKKRRLQFYAASGESINLIDDLIEVGYVDDGKILKAPDYLRGKLLK